jgi:molecular chaperone GrpE
VTEEREPQVATEDEQPSAEPATGAATGPAMGPAMGSVDGAEAQESRDDAPEAADNVPTDGAIDEGADAGAAEGGSAEEGLQVKLDELTGDLQRLQAEYLNYKRRVDRDRELVRENATYAALAPIVEVLDTIDRAREHGPLEGGFKAVADQLERVVAGLGLTKFGEPGEVFDPTLHEALSHLGSDPDVTETTVKVIAKAGYRIGERVVRAAQVLVVDPE